MDYRRGSVSYAYPWPGSVSGTQYFGYPNTAYSGASAITYPSQTPQPQKTTSKTTKQSSSGNTTLVAAVTVLAVLLFIAIIGLIAMGVILWEKENPPTTETPVLPTVVGFNVTRTDLIYNIDLTDSQSSTFSVTKVVFCDMVTREWYNMLISSESCDVVQFWPGSVIGRVQLSFTDDPRTDEQILYDVQSIITLKSSEDTRTTTVLSSSITIVS